MKTWKRQSRNYYYTRMITYAVCTLTLGSLGIYSLVSYMEERNITSQIATVLVEEGNISQKEAIMLIQHFPAEVREAIIEKIKDGLTTETVREVYAYYKEYNEEE